MLEPSSKKGGEMNVISSVDDGVNNDRRLFGEPDPAALRVLDIRCRCGCLGDSRNCHSDFGHCNHQVRATMADDEREKRLMRNAANSLNVKFGKRVYHKCRTGWSLPPCSGAF